MVLPTNEHDRLTNWINHRFPESAAEFAGIVVLSRPEDILAIVDPIPTSVSDLSVLERGRALVEVGTHEQRLAHARGDLGVQVRDILNRICTRFSDRGIDAEPNDGLGVFFGFEILCGSVLINSPERLREILKIDRDRDE